MIASWKQSGLRWSWLALVVVVLDQLAKLAILDGLPYGGPGINVLPFFNIVHVYNTGAAFSFLADQPGWQRWFFALFALGVSAAMAVGLRRQAANQLWLNLAFVLVIGGAIGNLIDRLAYGHVVDFLLFYGYGYFFPAFNLADCAITVGAVMIVLDGLRKKPVPSDEQKAS
jgi:lipoprotein signal peptidase